MSVTRTCVIALRVCAPDCIMSVLVGLLSFLSYYFFFLCIFTFLHLYFEYDVMIIIIIIVDKTYISRLPLLNSSIRDRLLMLFSSGTDSAHHQLLN